MLASNPRAFGSKQFNPQETVTLARFTIPAGGGTRYLGTLIVTIHIGLVDFLEAWKKADTDYDIRSLRVVDRLEEELSKLRGRFPVLPEPPVFGLMNTD